MSSNSKLKTDNEVGSVKLALTYLRVSSAQQAETDYDPEGFSIPAQRSACNRQVEDLDAIRAGEFVDQGESAKTSKRPALQAMLERIKKGDIDYVVVHKIDRLARNRADDVAIVAAIRSAGAQLISVTENIDETPTGTLLHGVMASFAEYYSSNLAVEIVKGSTQKAKAGGTPYQAPIGYLNTREIVQGREIRVVTVDPDRAPLIKYLFETYAKGEHSLSDMRDLLEEKGLRSRETPKMPSKALTRGQMQTILTNPYYIGKLRYAKKIYDGRHEPLITPELFEKVQRMLLDRRLSGERDRVHSHYLKGTLYCNECGARLMYSRNTGRHGGKFEYFVCRGRQAKTCSQPHHPVAKVEEAVERLYSTIYISREEHHRLITEAREAAALKGNGLVSDSARAKSQIDSLRKQERKLMTAHYADQISQEFFDEESARIRRERAAAEKTMRNAAADLSEVVVSLEESYELMKDVRKVYVESDPKLRKMINKAFWKQIRIDSIEDDQPELATPFAEIMAAVRGQNAKNAQLVGVSTDSAVSTGRDKSESPDLNFEAGGSISPQMVEHQGQRLRLLRCAPPNPALSRYGFSLVIQHQKRPTFR